MKPSAGTSVLAGRPKAHGEFVKVWDYVLGHIPLEEERWHRFSDFYLNSIRTMDLQVSNLHVPLLIRHPDVAGAGPT